MRTRLILALIAALLLSLSAFAAHPQKPGKWQLTIETEMPNMPMKIPPVTIATCITEKDLADPNHGVPTDPKSDCKVGDYKVDGNTVSWTVSCPKSKMTGSGQMTFSGDSYTGSTHMKVGDHEMSSKYTGKYLGACDK